MRRAIFPGSFDPLQGTLTLLVVPPLFDELIIAMGLILLKNTCFL